nr:MAG TPA: hypothetical protein [Crassvirales sp.]
MNKYMKNIQLFLNQILKEYFSMVGNHIIYIIVMEVMYS